MLQLMFQNCKQDAPDDRRTDFGWTTARETNGPAFGDDAIILDLRVLLFLVGPERPMHEELTEVDKSEYEAIDSLSSINFNNLLSGFGKSVPV